MAQSELLSTASEPGPSFPWLTSVLPRSSGGRKDLASTRPIDFHGLALTASNTIFLPAPARALSSVRATSAFFCFLPREEEKEKSKRRKRQGAREARAARTLSFPPHVRRKSPRRRKALGGGKSRTSSKENARKSRFAFGPRESPSLLPGPSSSSRCCALSRRDPRKKKVWRLVSKTLKKTARCDHDSFRRNGPGTFGGGRRVRLRLPCGGARSRSRGGGSSGTL
jgi:hypothetical protein